LDLFQPGCEIPFIFRRKESRLPGSLEKDNEEGAIQCRLVAESYIHGIMDGEGLQRGWPVASLDIF
jgi:hypothetical protein